MTQLKSFPVYGFKAIAGSPGQYEAYYAVFNNVDLVNDRIKEGAFKNSLERWKASGDPIPMIFSHGWDSMDNHVGWVEEAEEVSPGDPRLPEKLKSLGALRTIIQCDLEDSYGKKMDRLLAKRRVREGSFAYDVIREETAKDGVNDLLELDLIEVGPTLKGANPATQLASAGPRTKARVTVEGSYEELQSNLRKALAETPPAFGVADIWYVGLEGTYPDHCVAAVEPWEGPVKYYQVDYTQKKGAVTFGAPTEVAIRGVVAPIPVKSEVPETKANPEEPPAANGEEPPTKGLSRVTASLLLDLEELEAS
jgi:HK97 family phage prohead protease